MCHNFRFLLPNLKWRNNKAFDIIIIESLSTFSTSENNGSKFKTIIKLFLISISKFDDDPSNSIQNRLNLIFAVGLIISYLVDFLSINIRKTITLKSTQNYFKIELYYIFTSIKYSY